MKRKNNDDSKSGIITLDWKMPGALDLLQQLIEIQRQLHSRQKYDSIGIKRR